MVLKSGNVSLRSKAVAIFWAYEYYSRHFKIICIIPFTPYSYPEVSLFCRLEKGYSRTDSARIKM